MKKTFSEWLIEVMPLLLNHTVEKIEGEVISEKVEGSVSAYWAGAVLRIDLKPRLQ